METDDHKMIWKILSMIEKVIWVQELIMQKETCHKRPVEGLVILQLLKSKRAQLLFQNR